MTDPRFSAASVRAAYDTVAGDYAASFADDLERLPVDLRMLDLVVGRVRPGNVVLDLGCGPAPVGGYLAARGVPVAGVDLSEGTLRTARARNPWMALAQADMRWLPFRSGALGAVVAYYSVQHLPRSDLPAALGEIARVLARDGTVLLATHLGEGEVYFDELLGHRIEAVGGALYGRDELVVLVCEAGFIVEREERRGPLPHEADTQRIYLVARRSE